MSRVCRQERPNIASEIHGGTPSRITQQQVHRPLSVLIPAMALHDDTDTSLNIPVVEQANPTMLITTGRFVFRKLMSYGISETESYGEQHPMMRGRSQWISPDIS